MNVTLVPNRELIDAQWPAVRNYAAGFQVGSFNGSADFINKGYSQCMGRVQHAARTSPDPGLAQPDSVYRGLVGRGATYCDEVARQRWREMEAAQKEAIEATETGRHGSDLDLEAVRNIWPGTQPAPPPVVGQRPPMHQTAPGENGFPWGWALLGAGAILFLAYKSKEDKKKGKRR